MVSATVVQAAQAGDRAALEELLAAYLPLLYNIVGRALDGHADVDDVVQETLLRVVGNVSSLRDPNRFRPWLASIAIRQVRNRIQERQTSRAHIRPLAQAEAVAEPDFTDYTILRLSLDGQRRDLAEATRWLDDDDRELLSLWCLEMMQELSRADLRSALGLSESHTSVRLQRMRAQLDICRTVAAAVSPGSRCRGLGKTLSGWDGRPSPLWRKRIARHLRSNCPVCTNEQDSLIPVEKLMRSMLLTPVPIGIAGLWLTKAASAGAGSAATLGHTSSVGSWMSHTLLSKPLTLATLGVTVVAAGAGAGSTLYLDHHRQAPPAAVATPSTRAQAPSSTLSPTPRPTPTKTATPEKTRPVTSPGTGVYGSVVDQADTAPPVNRRPSILPVRPQSGVTIAASNDNDPRPDVVSLIYRGQNVTYQGQGYIRVEYQLSYNQRAGSIVPPSWTALQGKLFHVASGGGVRLDDDDPEGTAGATYLGNEQDGYDVLPPKAQQMWHFEYYYLDGEVTLNQNERGADYNLYVHLVPWKDMRDDIFTAPTSEGPLRYGLIRDNGGDTTPAPQYATRADPSDPATVPQMSSLTIG
jgi:RNA polymerase sigma factor (sigma-70 family)